jgi:hypothetical protein
MDSKNAARFLEPACFTLYFKGESTMQISFHWEVKHFDSSQIKTYEEKFTDDLQNVFKTNPKVAHVYFQQYIPSTLSGLITNESGIKLCDFNCELKSGNTTTYDFD